MLHKTLTLLLSLSLGVLLAQTGPGSLKGTVREASSGETIPFISVQIKNQADALVAYGLTDRDGKYHINPVSAGVYKVTVHVIGKKEQTFIDVSIRPNHITELDFNLIDSTTVLGTADVGPPKEKLIDKEPYMGFDRKEIKDQPGRTIIDFIKLKPGVFQDANGNTIIRGGRPETSATYINGIKIPGNIAIPKGAIGDIEVFIGGIRARYGDVTGGVTSITTRAPTGLYFGSAELVSSSLFDNYGHNLFGLTMGGPIWKNEKGLPMASFLLSAEYERNEEPTPSRVPYAELDASTLTDLEQNPLSVNPSGQTVFYRSEFITENDLNDVDARKNSYNNQLRLIGDLTFRTSRNSNLSIGGRWIYSNDKQANRFNHIFNYKTNMNQMNSDWNARASFTQFFTSDPKEESLIKNAFYTVQVDYSQNKGEVQDARYGTDFFKYGHIGSFDVLTESAYAFGLDSVSGIEAFRYIGESPTGINFTQGSNNTIRGNYTSQYFQLAETYRDLAPSTIEELIGNNIPINGTSPRATYDLWGSAGAAQGRYSKFRNGQFRVTGSVNFDIKDHSLIAGIEYEQRTDRFYNLDATGLWTQMRLLQNQPNQELDLANPILVRDANGVFQDSILYNYLYSANDASRFAESVRIANGLDRYSTERINVMNMDPDLFNLDFFSADELINPSGVSYTNYYGFDYKGNVQNGNVSVSDFFNAKDENGNLSRPISAFQPIYIAGYIEDKFHFSDLVFNVGIRVDRFDLNQEVLKDPFVLFPTHRVKDISATEISNTEINSVPSSIGQDYAVYVSSFDYSNASIVGYRNPENNQWFDALGDPIVDPQELSDAAGGGIKPLLVTPPTDDIEASKTLTSASFEDYKPQVVVMPRISFNFPVTDNAILIAHYDILAQRPLAATSRSNPFDYLNLLNKDAGGVLSNPNLRPQVTTEYELGFEQVISRKSTLKISAFYRELRDLVQTTSYTQAYPITYVTFTNIDFSTTKGFILEYNLRRTNNISLQANYTLQFADGTGSNANSGFSLANSGQPNLRYILPLDFDTRHQISVLSDFRYASGPAYTGPVWWNSNVFENAGINLVMNAISGTPYTKRVDFRNNAQVDGQINGSRLPWQLTFDAKINKVFPIKKSKQSFEVYFQILNLFNAQNTVNVYDFTGSADDDGYLSSATAAAQLTQQASSQSYVDLYNRAINTPGNYGLPRRIRLGVTYSF